MPSSENSDSCFETDIGTVADGVAHRFAYQDLAADRLPRNPSGHCDVVGLNSIVTVPHRHGADPHLTPLLFTLCAVSAS